MPAAIEGQLSAEERRRLTEAILQSDPKPEVIVEIGTWLGGGSTLHILQALHTNGTGHLWGIEADHGIYERMLANIQKAVPEAAARFTPLFGLSDQVIPKWISEKGSTLRVDFAFLDGGDNPNEQILEFQQLDPHIPVGGQLMAHDARCRKGKYFVPYLQHLDHWLSQVHDSSEVGLLTATKIADRPSAHSLAAAEATLRKLRRQPSELLAPLLPSKLKAIILRMVPRRWFDSLMGGHRS